MSGTALDDRRVLDMLVITDHEVDSDRTGNVERARAVAEILRNVDPATIRATGPKSALIETSVDIRRTVDGAHLFTVRTQLARRLSADVFTPDVIRDTVAVATVALERYRTRDRRSKEILRRTGLVAGMLLHDRSEDHPEHEIENVQWSTACPWSGAGVVVGEYDADGEWNESRIEPPDGIADVVPMIVNVHVDRSGIPVISCHGTLKHAEDGIMDAMQRLRAEARLATCGPYPKRCDAREDSKGRKA